MPEEGWALEDFLGVPAECRIGCTLLTADWCYVHNRYVVNCINKARLEDA